MDEISIKAEGNDVTAAFRDYLRPLLRSDLLQAAWWLPVTAITR